MINNALTIVSQREALWSPNRLRRQYPKVTLKRLLRARALAPALARCTSPNSAPSLPLIRICTLPNALLLGSARRSRPHSTQRASRRDTIVRARGISPFKPIYNLLKYTHPYLSHINKSAVKPIGAVFNIRVRISSAQLGCLDC